MHYKDYATEDFIQDNFFQQWIKTPNAENTRYWESFLKHYPHKRRDIEEAKAFILLMKFKKTAPDYFLENIKASLNERIDQHETNKAVEAREKVERVAPFRSAFKKYYWVAASLLLIVSSIAYTKWRKNNVQFAGKTEAQRGVETPKGKQTYIELPDGTRVWLNADSRLDYTKDLAQLQKREVFLEGEAFFDVAENKDKPFIVHTSAVAIRVLGTAFNVKSYAGDKVIETTLVRGKITLASKKMPQSEPITLTPNQQAVFVKDSGKIILEDGVNSDDYTVWKNGWLIFDDQPFANIIETLERRYDVVINMEDENSLACPFSGKFKDKTLEEVLEIFKNTESINYRIVNNQVFITGKLCEY